MNTKNNSCIRGIHMLTVNVLVVYVFNEKTCRTKEKRPNIGPKLRMNMQENTLQLTQISTPNHISIKNNCILPLKGSITLYFDHWKRFLVQFSYGPKYLYFTSGHKHIGLAVNLLIIEATFWWLYSWCTEQ